MLPQIALHPPAAPVGFRLPFRQLNMIQRAIQEKLGFLVFHHPRRIKKISIIGIELCQIAQQSAAVIAQTSEVIE